MILFRKGKSHTSLLVNQFIPPEVYLRPKNKNLSPNVNLKSWFILFPRKRITSS